MLSSFLCLQVVSGACESSIYSGSSVFLSLVKSNNVIVGSHWNEDHRSREKKEHEKITEGDKA